MSSSSSEHEVVSDWIPQLVSSDSEYEPLNLSVSPQNAKEVETKVTQAELPAEWGCDKTAFIAGRFVAVEVEFADKNSKGISITQVNFFGLGIQRIIQNNPNIPNNNP